MMSKLFAKLFYLLLILPEKCFSLASNWQPLDDVKIEFAGIINKLDEKQSKQLVEVTNKFKVFLKFYYDSADNYFDMSDLKKFICCSVFFIIYEISGSKQLAQINCLSEPFKCIKKQLKPNMLNNQINSDELYSENISDKNVLLLRQMRFREKEKINVDELTSLIDEILK